MAAAGSARSARLRHALNERLIMKSQEPICMSPFVDLEGEVVSHLDLSDYAAVGPDQTVAQVLQRMRQEQLSAVLVVDEGKALGIFTERDVLMRVAGAPATWSDPIQQHMTTEPIGVGPGDSLLDAVRRMNEGHFRNLPVLDEEGKPLGNLSQWSVIRYLTDRYPRDVYNLPPDPEAIPQTKEGA